jgi:epoxyqueuosine reductase QueG
LELLDVLRSLLAPMGVGWIGCADIAALTERENHGYPRALVLSLPLDKGIVSRIPTGPHKEYSDLYVSANKRLDEMSIVAQDYLRAQGHQALATTRDMISYNRDTYASDYAPHKTLARLAGLGWIGKCALLVTREYGTAHRMTAVLTDAPLEPGTPVEQGLCGDCTNCRDVCPGGAIRGQNWTLGMSRDDLIDPRACDETLSSRAEGHPGFSTTCGLCIAACPYTQAYLQSE